MHLVYNAFNSEIIATLEEGEILGGIEGPIEMSIPSDPNNTQFAAILRRELVIEPYEPPTE